ncbi:MAG: GAF domain-containing protein [Anaerolineae bacterium]
MNEIVQAVTYAVKAGEVREVLHRIAQAARSLVGASYAALGVPDGDGGLLYFTHVGLSEEQTAQIPHPPQGRGLLGAIMTERKSIRLNDMALDARSSGFPPGHPPMSSFLGVPIQVGDQLFGMLYLTDRVDGQPFDEYDEWLIETIAGYAALAIAGVRLHEQQSRIQLFEERERISMALHDGIIQDLYAIGMHLELLRSQPDIQPADLNPAMGALNNVIDDIRAYILDLRTSSYEKRTVYECMDDMVRRLGLYRELDVSLDVPHAQPPLSPVTFEALCQIVHEGLSNVARHAEAQHVRIRCWHQGGRYFVVVEDDGIGFDPQNEASEHGMGLRNIRQRARLHGGEVRITSTPGVGTLLRISMPALSVNG